MKEIANLQAIVFEKIQVSDFFFRLSVTNVKPMGIFLVRARNFVFVQLVAKDTLVLRLISVPDRQNLR